MPFNGSIEIGYSLQAHERQRLSPVFTAKVVLRKRPFIFYTRVIFGMLLKMLLHLNFLHFTKFIERKLEAEKLQFVNISKFFRLTPPFLHFFAPIPLFNPLFFTCLSPNPISASYLIKKLTVPK